MRKSFLFTLILAMIALPALAQDADDESKNELGLTIGAEIIPGNSFVPTTLVPGPSPATLNFSKSVVFGFNYARRLKSTENIALYLEIPFAAAPSHAVASNRTDVPTSQATLYITPSLRVNFARKSRLSPWLSFGGGYGLYEGSELLGNGAPNPDRFASVGTLQFGGGLDVRTGVKILVPVNLRFEVRDFYTLSTQNFIAGRPEGQHNVFVGGGLILRF